MQLLIMLKKKLNEHCSRNGISIEKSLVKIYCCATIADIYLLVVEPELKYLFKCVGVSILPISRAGTGDIFIRSEDNHLHIGPKDIPSLAFSVTEIECIKCDRCYRYHEGQHELCARCDAHVNHDREEVRQFF